MLAALLALALTLTRATAQTTVVSDLNPTPLTLNYPGTPPSSASSSSSSASSTRNLGPISTEQAGESPLTSTRIGFPTMLDWWVVGALNQIEWDWVEPVDGNEVKLNVLLDNLDKKLCPQPVRVNEDETVWAYWSGWGRVSELKG